MLFGTAHALRDEIHGAAEQAMSWPQKMACIESFAIHARVLEAFIWDSPSKAYPDGAELTHLFPAMKAPAAARALPNLAERAREEERTAEL